MKHLILAAFALLSITAQAQNDESILWNNSTVHLGIGTSFGTARVPDCEAWETFTEWQAENPGKGKCSHDWVVAEWREVNTLDLFTTLEMPPPCGKTRHENEARICRACLRHETRVRSHGMKEVQRKSEFQLLLEKIKDR